MRKINAKTKVLKFVELLILFLFIYGFKLNTLPVNTSKIAVLLLLSIAVVLLSLNSNGRFFINKKIGFSIVLILLLFFVSLVFSVFHETYDFNVPYFYFILGTEAFLGAFLFFYVFLKNKSEKEFLDEILLILVFQSVIIAAMLFFSNFRDLIFSLTPSENLEDMNERYGGFRGLGLSGSVTYDLAIVQSFGLMIISYLNVKYKVNNFCYVLGWFILFLSVLVTGRTGWVGIFFSLSFLVVFGNRKFVWLSVFRIFFIASLIFSVLFTYIYFYQYWIIEYFSLTIAPYAFELFINFFQGDGVTTKSTEKLEEMYFWVGENTFLFGDGLWEKKIGGGYYGETDAGLMRHLLYYGFLPSMLLVFSYSYFFYSILKYSRSVVFRYFICLIFIYVMLAHFKGNFLIGSPMGVKFVMLMLVFYGAGKKYSKSSITQ